MPVKNGGESDGDVSGGESEHSNSSQGHESSDEANEIDSDDSSEMDVNEIERRRSECLEILGKSHMHMRWLITTVIRDYP